MSIEISDLTTVDEARVRAFLERVSPGDRTFFGDNVLAEGVAASWLAEPAGRRFVAHKDGSVLGLLTIEQGVAWSRHVGEIRIVVDRSARRLGIGKALARQALLAGLVLDLDKLVVQVAAEDEATTRMFLGLAFEPEAILRAHVRDDSGTAYDLLVLSHFVHEARATLATMGVPEALGL